jgi:gas vesicle protein
MRGFIRFVTGLLLGASLGFLLGLLLAPLSGEELKITLRERADAAIAEGQKGMAERRQELEEELVRARRGERRKKSRLS